MTDQSKQYETLEPVEDLGEATLHEPRLQDEEHLVAEREVPDVAGGWIT